MEQIQQHEWAGNYFLKVCVHCNCRKYEHMDKSPAYQAYGSAVHEYALKEPGCITRYSEQNIKEDETDNADCSR